MPLDDRVLVKLGTVQESVHILGKGTWMVMATNEITH